MMRTCSYFFDIGPLSFACIHSLGHDVLSLRDFCSPMLHNAVASLLGHSGLSCAAGKCWQWGLAFFRVFLSSEVLRGGSTPDMSTKAHAHADVKALHRCRLLVDGRSPDVIGASIAVPSVFLSPHASDWRSDMFVSPLRTFALTHDEFEPQFHHRSYLQTPRAISLYSNDTLTVTQGAVLVGLPVLQEEESGVFSSLDWIESRILVFWRSFLLLYLLSFCHVFSRCVPFRADSPRRNKVLFRCRRSLAGAPVHLVFVWAAISLRGASAMHSLQAREGYRAESSGVTPCAGAMPSSAGIGHALASELDPSTPTQRHVEQTARVGLADFDSFLQPSVEVRIFAFQKSAFCLTESIAEGESYELYGAC